MIYLLKTYKGCFAIILFDKNEIQYVCACYCHFPTKVYSHYFYYFTFQKIVLRCIYTFLHDFT